MFMDFSGNTLTLGWWWLLKPIEGSTKYVRMYKYPFMFVDIREIILTWLGVSG